MEQHQPRHDASSLRDYLHILQRRKWIVVLPILLVPLIALLISLRQPRLYDAASNVFFNTTDVSAAVSGLPQTYQDPFRYAQTQVAIMSTLPVAQRVQRRAHLTSRTPAQILGELNVAASPNADYLSFRIRDGDPLVAQRLANAYAAFFKTYRYQLDTATIKNARRQIEQRLADFQPPPSRRSPLYDTYIGLVQHQQQLSTAESLQSSGGFLVRRALGAVQIQPKPKRDAALGLGLGVLLGLGLAFLWHALDTRVRSAEEIREGLGIPLLGRIPVPSRKLRRANEMTMLAAPASAQAEAFRMLRANFEFVNLERRARSVMFTSAAEGEGKSTTVVNLAIAFARAGHRVVLVDLDLRRPALHRIFALDERRGLTDVALGGLTLEDAISSVAVAQPSLGNANEAGNGNGRLAGFLEVLPAGTPPSDPGEFVSSATVGGILASLSHRADIVFVDSPPLLHVGDAMALSAWVDALVIVSRLNAIRRPMLAELRRLMHSCPATPLGFVVTGADLESSYGYAGSYDYSTPRSTSRQPVV